MALMLGTTEEITQCEIPSGDTPAWESSVRRLSPRLSEVWPVSVRRV